MGGVREMSLLPDDHRPANREGAFLVQDTDPQSHPTAPNGASIHHQHHRTGRKACEQRIEIRQKVNFRRDALILDKTGQAFEPTFPQTARRGFTGNRPQLTLATADDAADEKCQSFQMTGMISRRFGAAEFSECRKYGTITSEAVAPFGTPFGTPCFLVET